MAVGDVVGGLGKEGLSGLKWPMLVGRRSVCVVGSGPAGMAAALLLSRLGYEVDVLEADCRPGGRLKTIHLGGLRAESGAGRVPVNHRAVLDLAREVRLPMRSYRQMNPDARYKLDGVTGSLRDWADGTARSLHPGAQGDDWTSNEPDTMWKKIMAELLAHLTDEELRAARTPDLGGSEKLRRLSEIPLWQAILELPNGYSSDTIRILSHLVGMSHCLQFAALGTVVEYRIAFNANMLEPVHGMEDFVERLVQHVGRRNIHLGHRVTAIEARQEQMLVTFTTVAGPSARMYDYVICTVPARAIAGIRFAPDLPPRQQDAFNRYSYLAASKSCVYYPTRWWEKLGIVGGTSFTDVGSQIIYPSDNLAAYDTGDFLAEHFPAGNPPRMIRAVANGYRARSPKITEAPGIVIVYRKGPAATHHARLPKHLQDEATLRDLCSIHGPVVNEAELIKHVDWPVAFAHDRPGDHLNFQPVMGVPHPVANPRVFFAGEHLGYPHGWIQAAIESAWAAALEVARCASGSKGIDQKGT